MMYARNGVGEYDKLGTDYSWMFYPPPYDFQDPLGVQPPFVFLAPAEAMDMTSQGLGCGDGGCTCGGACGGGLGSIDWSLMSTDLAAQFGLSFIPNIVVYGLGGFLFAKAAEAITAPAGSRRSRRRSDW